MSPPTNQPQQKNQSPSTLRGTIYNLEIVFLVALLMATFFTAWTPGSNTLIADLDEPEVAAPSNPDLISQQEQNLPETTLQPAQTSATAEASPQLGIVVGHWGDTKDPGAVCSDGQLTELQVNQNVAALVEKSLADQGYQVILLKEFDPRLSGFRALAMISIHADSCNYINDQATGYKVAAAVGKQNQDKSVRLAACLRNRYGEASGLGLHSTSITPDMTSYHAFDEIDPETPAAIIETGFLNLDRQFLTENPNLAAQGIVAGIQCFLNNESITPATTQPTP
jgi:N-acetylmuramoyl-L-alanine amidase